MCIILLGGSPSFVLPYTQLVADRLQEPSLGVCRTNAMYFDSCVHIVHFSSVFD